MDLAARIVSRRGLGPVSILCLCSGMCIEIAVLLELGFDVKLALATELGPAARSISSASFPMVRFSPSNDVNDNTAVSEDTVFFAGFAGPQCIHWSVLRDHPGGYKEPGSSTFTACAVRLRDEKLRCDMFSYLETVPVHQELRNDMVRQERECGGPLQLINANDTGGPAGRPRRLFAPDVDFSRIERFRHTNPNLCADDGWQFRDLPIPAPVARDKLTKSPIVLIKAYGNWEPRFANPDERDRINPGLKAGISSGYGRLRSVPESVRNRANGNAFSADTLWAVARLWVVQPKVPAILAVSSAMQSWPAALQLEKFAADDELQFI